MKKPLDIVIAARARRPVTIEQWPFDGWLFGLVLELASPAEAFVLEALARHGEQTTAQLIERHEAITTPHQMGATLSRLRRLGLVWTIRQQGMGYHDLTGWARIGGPSWKAGNPEQHTPSGDA